MKRMVILPAVLLLAATAARAEQQSGATALALAALVGENSPTLSDAEKKLLGQYLDGNADAPHTAGQKVEVTAENVRCSASNVDITLHRCELQFGGQNVTLQGRKAHELYATLDEADASSEGSAGSMNETLSKLSCLIDADAVAGKGGGGASCTFKKIDD